MDEKKVAVEILDAVGGPSNISHLEHCSTRLRFTIVKDELVDVEKIKKIPGVLGVNQTAQTQIIIGNAVIEVYNELQEMIKGKRQQQKKRKIRSLQLLFSTLSSVFSNH